ncbi:Nitric oxide reductase [Ignavibacterium album JCM 16511]|uniref:Nitric oxide reductase n=1 Tax=Ignavibacterium album (strain DSM 19864 / JCM 16511 / NBRC 101810 / Mat9-16) TaxID=945713 RepID=I0API7_IGNAJ|nr:cytochrome P460 family protein [Ignavibacterium album]AFH50894.1 Nitric oxide reductase [Ignavibacterium album JCM 16511]
MKKQIIISIFSVAAILVGAAVLFGFSNDEVKYPEGYRNWTHVKTLILEKGHPLYDAFGGIHHIYANKTALEGYKAGNKFKDGSVIVFDLLETVSADNAVAEGNRKVVGVMEKNSKKYRDTGGWGFEAFKGDTRERVVKNMEGDCFSCHLSQKDKDYVFSEYRK